MVASAEARQIAESDEVVIGAVMSICLVRFSVPLILLGVLTQRFKVRSSVTHIFDS